MKIMIVGTGVIGTIYGWSLAESGNEVIHYVRKGKADRLKDGIKIKMLDERKGHPKDSIVTYNIKCTDVIPDGDIPLVIVPVNNFQLENVLKELAPKLDKSLFLIMTSNWEGTGSIDKILSNDRYMMGYPDGGGTFENGHMIANIGASIHLGEIDGSNSPRLQHLADLFKKADMTPEVAENIVHWLWMHNAGSVAIWAGFYMHRDIKTLMKDRALLTECFYASRECLDICRKRGVDMQRYDDLKYFNYPAWLFIIMFKMLYTFNKSMQVYTAHAKSDSCIAELKGSFMEVYQTGTELGVPMPYMSGLKKKIEAQG